MFPALSFNGSAVTAERWLLNLRIRASTKQRGKGDIRDDKGVGHLVLTAESDSEREFVTCVYRILAEDGKQQEQGRSNNAKVFE
jgi:hypothetical protein